MISALTTLQQWLLFTGTTVVVGCVAWRARVLPGAVRSLPGEHGGLIRDSEGRVATMGLVGTGVLVVAWGLRLLVQVMGFRDPFVPLWDDVSFLLFEIFWGTVWMAQGVVIVLLALALWLAGRRRTTPDAAGPGATMTLSPGWVAATFLTGMLAMTLALSGHAMGADARALAVTADTVHTLAAGSWIGSLGVILALGRGQDATDPALFAAQIRSFSPLAMASVAALVSMGVVLGWTHLHTVSDLWTLPYGRILSAKVALVFGILALGFWNWRRGLPVLDSVDGAAAVRRRAFWEVSLAVGVILLTAVLVHSPKP